MRKKTFFIKLKNRLMEEEQKKTRPPVLFKVSKPLIHKASLTFFQKPDFSLKERIRKTLRHHRRNYNVLRLLFYKGLEGIFSENVILLKEGVREC